jgi:uncharacterized membrane protein
MSPIVWQVLLFTVLPLLGIYTGLMVWSARRDRWPRR